MCSNISLGGWNCSYSTGTKSEDRSHIHHGVADGKAMPGGAFLPGHVQAQSKTMKRSFNNHYKPAILWLDSCQRYFGRSPTENIHLMLTHGFVFHCGLCVCLCVCTFVFEHLNYLPNSLRCLSLNILLLEPLGQEKMSLACHRPVRYKVLPGCWGKMELKKKGRKQFVPEEMCPVEKHLLCNPKSFVSPWKTNSFTVKNH